MEKQIKGIINNWKVFTDNKNKDCHFHIMGEFNGEKILTSRVLNINYNIVETFNSKYELGFPKDTVYDLMA